MIKCHVLARFCPDVFFRRLIGVHAPLVNMGDLNRADSLQRFAAHRREQRQHASFVNVHKHASVEVQWDIRAVTIQAEVWNLQVEGLEKSSDLAFKGRPLGT